MSHGTINPGDSYEYNQKSWKFCRKQPPGRIKNRMEKNIKKKLKKILWESAEFCHVAHDRSSSRVSVMDFWAP